MDCLQTNLKAKEKLLFTFVFALTKYLAGKLSEVESIKGVT